ncbi:MAG: signal peptidase I [Fusobacteriaceae bacterium]|jgi:signal peptidase I|nr:signal peptidase I [Fusobacteriaceae bacterium]
MNRSKIYLYAVFYFLLTAFLLYVLIREEKVGKIIGLKREKITAAVLECFHVTKGKAATVIRNVIWLLEFVISTLLILFLIRTFYLGNFVVPTGSMIPTILEQDRLFANMAVYRFRKPRVGEIFIFKEPVTDKDLYTKRVMGLPGDRVSIRDDSLYINDKKTGQREYVNAGKLGYDTWLVPKRGDLVEIIPKMDYTAFLRGRKINVEEVQKHLMDDLYEIDKVLPDLEVRVNGEKTGMLLDVLHEKKQLQKLMEGETLRFTLEKDYYFALGDNTRNSFDSRMWGFVAEDRIKGRPLIRFWPLKRVGILR